MNIHNSIQKIRIRRELQEERTARIKTFVALAAMLFIGIFIGNFFVQDNLTLTGLVTGNLPDVGESNWGTILNNYLLQEHTENGTHKNVTVEGDLNVSGNITDTSGGLLNVPSGMIAFFKLSACPTGWTQDPDTVGRYIVGINESGTLNATIGTALNDSENRPVGNHTHDVIDPGHFHTYKSSSTISTGNFVSRGLTDSSTRTVSTATTDITINNTGNISGTNAPYIQLLTCIKT